mmetsp:Transcript_50291/g.118346  ORF Transcript_50291/g.118346 Transcript_50291/m.118346 type:complete len:412 (-) Transcript_50291:178-1413(-)
MDTTILAVVLALLAVVVGWFFMSNKSDEKGKPPAEEKKPEPAPKKEQAKPKAAESKATGKKGAKKETGHPQCLCMFKGHTDNLTCLRFSTTGKFAGTTSEDRKTIVWDLSKVPPTQAYNLSLELDHGIAVAFSPDDKYLAVAYARSKEVKIYPMKNAKDGAVSQFKSGHKGTLIGMQWANNGRFVVTCSDDSKDNVHVFSSKGQSLGVISPGALETYSSTISPDSRFISVASMQCDAKLWEVGDKDGEYKVVGKAMELTGRSGGGGAKGHSAAVHCVSFGGPSPGVLSGPSNSAATVSKDGTCKVWNIDVRYKFQEDPKCSATLPSPDGNPLHLCALSREASPAWLAAFSRTAGLLFFSLADNTLKSQIPISDCGSVFQMEWCPSPLAGHAAVLGTASTDGKSRLWVPEPL